MRDRNNIVSIDNSQSGSFQAGAAESHDALSRAVSLDLDRAA
jgi:hypothetical protein